MSPSCDGLPFPFQDSVLFQLWKGPTLASPLYREMPHLNRLWDGLCGSNVNGGAGVLSWQGIRFLLNRLQEKQIKQEIS